MRGSVGAMHDTWPVVEPDWLPGMTMCQSPRSPSQKKASVGQRVGRDVPCCCGFPPRRNRAALAPKQFEVIERLKPNPSDASRLPSQVSGERKVATSEIHRVIGCSPTDVQPVFETIARVASASVAHLGAWSSSSTAA